MKKIFALLENIRSLHNVGSVFRCGDGAGIDKIILGGYTGTPPRKEITKVSLGAEENIAWEKAENVQEKIKELRAEGVFIVGIEENIDSKNLWEVQLPDRNICLVFGHEVDGITDETLELCDTVCSLPMYGMKRSLNVSVCAGVVFYELARRKNT